VRALNKDAVFVMALLHWQQQRLFCEAILISMSSKSSSKPAVAKRTTTAATSSSSMSEGGSAAKRAKGDNGEPVPQKETEIDIENSEEESEIDEEPTAEDLEFIDTASDHGLDEEAEAEFQSILAALRGGRVK